MAFEAPRSVEAYPPAAFRAKYEMFLAPYGELLSPEEVFQNKMLGSAAKENLKKAFEITAKKLEKMRELCAKCGAKPESPVACDGCRAVRYCNDRCRNDRAESHALVCSDLRNERFDQLLECLPSPLSLGQEILLGLGGFVANWSDWFERHTTLGEDITYAIETISKWWEYMGSEQPDSSSLEACLKRSASNVFSTVLTIASSVYWLRQPTLFKTSESSTGQPQAAGELPQLEKDLYIHLIGSDKPEVSIVESGLVQLCSRVLLGSRAHLTLVAPDLERQPHMQALPATAPLQMGPDMTIGCYAGLYHNFWDEHVSASDPSNKVSEPTVAVAIHPGCHTSEMWQLWEPTFQLLKEKRVPLFLTTYNQHEHENTLKALQTLQPTVLFEGKNPLRSLLVKRTPYEPDHVWASNAFAIGISFA